MQLTQHFSLEEMTHSLVAGNLKILNEPSPDIQRALLFTAAGMERIRALLCNEIIISSGYRSPALNHAVGGANDSQHMFGEACDFTCPNTGNPKQIASILAQNRAILGIDQIILESTWVHVSFTHAPRHEVLTNREGRYLQGIV